MRSKIFIGLCVITLFQNSYAAPAKVKADPVKDYWKGSGLSIDEFIKDEASHCNDDALHVLGCVEALNVLAHCLSPSQVFLASSEVTAGMPGIGKLITAYPGGLSLYETVKQESKVEDGDLLKRIKESKKEKQKHVDAIQALASAKKVNFTEIFNETKKKLIDSNVLSTKLNVSEEAVAAQLYNSNFAIIRDPHTMLWPREFQDELLSGKTESVAGIAANLESVGGKITIMSLQKESPLLDAGLKVGDVIFAINGEAISDKKVEDVLKLLQGEEGTTAYLTMNRKDQVFNADVVRKNIRSQTVDYYTVDDNGTRYGYVRLRDFMDVEAPRKMYEALIDLKHIWKVKGYIIDLRGNPGGIIGSAVTMGGFFLGNDKVVVGAKLLNSSDNQIEYAKASTQVVDLETPMVTLIDGGSASASEILAGAFQDHQRSWIVGDRSHGKATVQGPDTSYPLSQKHKQVILYSTIARFYQPSGRTNQLVGILPDFSVDPTPNATAMEKYTRREEDNYTALPSVGNRWKQPRKAEIEKINQCRAARAAAGNSADQHFQSQSEQATVAPDYRLLVAQDILSCSQL